MTENSRRKIQGALWLISLPVSCLVISYFWFMYDYNRKAEIWVMVLAAVFLAIEIGKKNLLKDVPWWNRLYYIGLLGIMAPMILKGKMETESIKWITNISVLFLFAPLLAEAGSLFKAKQK